MKSERPGSADPWPDRCPHASPGGMTPDGRLPRKGTRCGNYKGHDGDHTVLIPSDAPWWPSSANEGTPRPLTMPEPPDFEQIARTVVPFCLGVKYAEDVKEACGLVAEQLRQTWNARGAADAKAVEERLATLTGWVTSEPYRQHLRDAITGLDR